MHHKTSMSYQLLYAMLMLAGSLLATYSQADEAVAIADEMPKAALDAVNTVSMRQNLVTDRMKRFPDSRLNALQQRLLLYMNSDDATIRYQAHKAQSWLVFAANEQSTGSHKKTAQAALMQATSIADGLDHQQTLSLTTPILANSQVMRRDLWVTAEQIKAHTGFKCAANELAQAEVMLVWGAANYCDLGWRSARPLFSSADRLINQAKYQALTCQGEPQQALKPVTYPSFEQLNGKTGCHGVVGTWPINVSPTTP